MVRKKGLPLHIEKSIIDNHGQTFEKTKKNKASS